jgi:hypothetical protein
MSRSRLRIGLTQKGSDEGGSTGRTSKQIEDYHRRKRTFQYKKNDRGKVIKIEMLTGGQAKLDKNKNNRIDAQDFKILKAEKAKGRGMGLQDEKVQPGKVMKAKRGKSIMTEKVKSTNFAGYTKAFEGPQNKGRVSTISGVKPTLRGGRSKTARTAITASSLKKNLMKTKNPYSDLVKTTAKGPENFMKRRKALAGARSVLSKTRIGKIALGVAAAGIGAKKYLESKMKKKKDVKKKKSGGIIQKMYESGKLEKFKLTPTQRADMVKKARLSLKATRESLTDRNQPMKAQRLRDSLLPPKKMGGGMMQRPMGYDIGGGVKKAQEHKKKIKDKAGTALGYAGEIAKTLSTATPLGVAKQTAKLLVEDRTKRKKSQRGIRKRLNQVPRTFPSPKRRLPLPLDPKQKRPPKAETLPRRIPGKPPVYTPLNKGGGADSGKKNTVGTLKPNPGDKAIHHFGRRESKPYTGGNRSRPKILASGGSVKVKCKLGRNKPTKMY